MGADLGARVHGAAVEADAGAARRPVGGDLARVGAERGARVLGRDPALQRGAAESDGLLLESQFDERLPRGDAHLRDHEVDVGDLFGDRVLDLDARVHLDEHVLPCALARGVEQELDGARVHVADRPGEGDRVAVEGLTHVVGEVGRGRDLDDLLVPPLHRAVALEEVDRLARGIREHLHLDVPRTKHRLLEEHRGVAECAVGLTHRLFERGAQLVLRVDAAHPATAATRDRLREDRETDLVGLGDEGLDVARRRCGLQHRHTGGDRVLLGSDLVAGHLEHVLRRPDEGDACLDRRLRELGILREETVTGVDRVGARLLRDADDLGHVEVRPNRMPRLADLVGLVRLQAVQRIAILERVHRDRLGSELDGRTKRPDGDLPAIGYQDLREHAGGLSDTGFRTANI